MAVAKKNGGRNGEAKNLHYSFDERLTCFTFFVHGMSLEQIAKERPPSLATLKRWCKEEQWEARRAAIQERALAKIEAKLTRQKAAFVVLAWEKILKLLNAVDDPGRLESAAVHQITTAIGTLIDKAALLQGEGVPGGYDDSYYDEEDVVSEAEKIAASWTHEG